MPPPANDDFANRTTLSGSSGTWSGTNVDATTEAGEPDPAFGIGSPGTSIWFEWTCPATDRYQWDTFTSDFDTVLDILQGVSLAALTNVAVNDDCLFEDQGVQSGFRVDLTSGQVYLVRVGGYGGDTGNVVLNWAPYVSTRPADPPVGQVQLLDGYACSGARYDGRWVVNIPPLSPAPGDANVNEYDFAIAKPDTTPVGFLIDSDLFPANAYAGGLIFDSADPDWEFDDFRSYLGTIPPDAQTYDGVWAGPFDLGFAFTIDEAHTDPNWWREDVPTIFSITPNYGIAGDSIVIVGHRLGNTYNVGHGGFYGGAGLTIDSDTQVTITVDVSWHGNDPITLAVHWPNAPFTVNVDSGAFYILEVEPQIASFTPGTGVPGDVITVNGSHFVGVTDVHLRESVAGILTYPCMFTVEDDATIVFTAPVAPGGTYLVVLTNVIGSDQDPDLPPYVFTLVATPPAVTSFAPSSGKPGDLIVITGTNFTGVTGAFGSDAWFNVDSDTQVTAQVPLGCAGGPVAVTGPTGTGESVDTFTVIRPARPSPINDVYGDGSARAGGTPTSDVGNCWFLLGYVNNPDGFTPEAVGGTLEPHWHVIASGTLDGYFWAVWAKLVSPDDIGYGAHIVPVTHVTQVTYCAAFITVWEDVFDVGTGVVGSGTGEVLTAPPALAGETAGVADGVPTIVVRPPLIDYGGSGDILLNPGDWRAVGIDVQTDVYAAMFLLKSALDADDATFETGIGAWDSGLADYDLQRVTTPTPHRGSGVLQITFLGGSPNPADTPNLGSATGDAHATPVSPGRVAKFAGWFQADPGNAHVGEYSVIVTLRATRANGTTAGEFVSEEATLSESGWGEITVVGTMPSGAKWLSITTQIVGPGMTGMLTAGDRFYLSDVSMDVPLALRVGYDEQAAIAVRTAQSSGVRIRKDRS